MTLLELLKKLYEFIYYLFFTRPNKQEIILESGKKVTVNDTDNLMCHKKFKPIQIIQVENNHITKDHKVYMNEIFTVNNKRIRVHDIIEGFHVMSLMLLDDCSADECAEFVKNLVVSNKFTSWVHCLDVQQEHCQYIGTEFSVSGKRFRIQSINLSIKCLKVLALSDGASVDQFMEAGKEFVKKYR